MAKAQTTTRIKLIALTVISGVLLAGASIATAA